MFSMTAEPCATCDEIAVFHCNGCTQAFCENHADEHRQSLDEQLDWLTVDHDDLANKLQNQTSTLVNSHSSMELIDNWERETIANIRLTASNTRQAFLDAVERHVDNVKTRLPDLTTKLTKACEHDLTFNETHLKQWSNILRNLKEEMQLVSKLTIVIEDEIPVLVSLADAQSDFSLENCCTAAEQQSYSLAPILPSSPREGDRFDRFCGDVQIVEDGQVIVHKSCTGDASVRGLYGYSSGEHKLHFRIEHMHMDQWIFFGIISSQSPLHRQSFMMPSAYGWAGNKYVYVNGEYISGFHGYRGGMQVNDIVELTLDCDQRTLCLWHSRKIHPNKLSIDLQACPFPWQFSLSLFNANDSVRILPPSIGCTIKEEELKNNNANKKQVEFNENIEYFNTLKNT